MPGPEGCARPAPWFDLPRGLSLLACALTLAAGAFLAALPVYSSVSESVSGSSSGTSSGTEVSTGTLLSESGPGILVILAVPVVATLLPLWARRRGARTATAIAAAAVLLVCTTLGTLSVGVFYAPATLAAVVAAIVTATRRPAPARTYEIRSASPTGSTS